MSDMRYLNALTKALAETIALIESMVPEGMSVSILIAAPDNPRAHLYMGEQTPAEARATLDEMLANPGHKEHATDADGVVVPPERMN